MYNLPYFKENDKEVIGEFIRDNPFAFITGCTNDLQPVATQIPVFLEAGENEKQVLRGHIMKQTDHHKAFMQNPQVLVVFSGHHSYVSATWYSNPQQASTWNYMSVHAKGLIRFLDEKGLEDVLRKTTLYFEKENKESPTVFDNLPADYKEKLMKAIIAFEIEILQMDNVFKLSQNRNKKSYEHIIEKLKNQDGDAKEVAAEMEKRTDQLFPGGEDRDENKFSS